MSDSETTTLTINEGDSEVRQMYVKLMNSVVDIDDKISAGTEAAGTRKFTNDLVSENESEWKGVSERLSNMLTLVRDGDPEKGTEPNFEAFVGSFYGIQKTLAKQFKEAADAWIKQQVEALPKSDTPEASEAEKAQLVKARQELVKQLKTVIDMAVIFGDTDEDHKWAMPKRLGAVGKRGKRALSSYNWFIDDVAMEGDDNSVAGVSKALGFEKSADFTTELRNQKVMIDGKEENFDTKTPPVEFTFNIRGKEVYGVKQDENAESEEDEDPSEPTIVEDDE
jgi:hypothetical protein